MQATAAMLTTSLLASFSFNEGLNIWEQLDALLAVGQAVNGGSAGDASTITTLVPTADGLVAEMAQSWWHGGVKSQVWSVSARQRVLSVDIILTLSIPLYVTAAPHSTRWPPL